ncbi:hypothetical protein NDU88_003399 [Pleurodeles waltl]|uniref:Uncharacterized protein n=1 Tax=Pleurodeles waltl TaxID=8319 RepID=A0AAV7SG41_PLEWA|nr:hypothetical protein NDU88_003399 [Pleurodeles waltl]
MTDMSLNPVSAGQPPPLPGHSAPSAAHCGPRLHHRPAGALHLRPGGSAPLTTTALQQWMAPLVPLGPPTGARPGTPPGRSGLRSNSIAAAASSRHFVALGSPSTAALSQLAGSQTLRGWPPSTAIRAHHSAGPACAQRRSRPRLVLRAPLRFTGTTPEDPVAPVSLSYGLSLTPPLQGPLMQDKNWAQMERDYFASAMLAGQATPPSNQRARGFHRLRSPSHSQHAASALLPSEQLCNTTVLAHHTPLLTA